MKLEVICMDEPAYFAMLDKMLEYVKGKQGNAEDKWISGVLAMKKLGITSKATLQKLRDNGSIRFTKDTPVMMYDNDSIKKYLEDHAQNTF